MDPRSPLAHTGTQPARRPPEDEPERVGEGELDIGPPADQAGDETPKAQTRDSSQVKPSDDVVSD